MSLRRGLSPLGLLLIGLMPLAAQAAGGEITLFNLNDTENGQEFSVKLQILIIMTLL
nr:flagellar biosynthetic protein FliP [Stutzerimonas stutzeri]